MVIMRIRGKRVNNLELSESKVEAVEEATENDAGGQRRKVEVGNVAKMKRRERG